MYENPGRPGFFSAPRLTIGSKTFRKVADCPMALALPGIAHGRVGEIELTLRFGMKGENTNESP
jgi:hypothetical protein